MVSSGVTNSGTGDGHDPLMSYNPHMITSWDGHDPSPPVVMVVQMVVMVVTPYPIMGPSHGV
jgi:hypothetical protein